MEQKVNYQKQMEAYLDAHPVRERLALHSCCGPCSTSVLEVLQKHFDVDGSAGFYRIEKSGTLLRLKAE